ncbi:MAG: BatA and WFA domain-containing protein [Chloroflexi bacterium]|nr:BatA and WFA domain-containing protein [Chloroflexota bacterium]
MSFAQPFALLGLLAAIPIVLLYILRGNVRRRPTTAAFLWRGIATQVTARNRLRPPPRSLSLLLQLLALLGLVLALARPALLQRTGRQLILLLDASASMQATDVTPSRFAQARDQLAEVVRGMAATDRATIVRVGAQPTILAAGSDRSELERVLAAAQPGVAPASLRDALVLASRQLQGTPSEGSEIVVATDGTLDDPNDLAPLVVPVRFISLGRSGANRGISTLLVARAPGEGGQLAAFAQVSNYGDTSQRVQVQLSADGLPLDTRSLDLPARGRGGLWVDLPAETRSAGAVLLDRDALALDDQAEVTVGENRRRSVLLVSRTPDAWQRALQAIAGLDVAATSPEAYRDQGADIVVFDSFVPSRLPGGQLILVNPPPGNAVVDVAAETRGGRIRTLDASHPLLRGLDLGAVYLVKASVLRMPRWASAVAETRGGPLVLQGELQGRRVLVYGFDPILSGLEKLVVFPILVANAIDFLNVSGTDPYVSPGQNVALPVRTDAREAVLERPDGTSQNVSTAEGAARLDGVDGVGRYALRVKLATGEFTTRTFFVNLFGESEPDILPRRLTDWAARSQLPAEQLQAGAELWQLFAALSLGLLTIEWLRFARRG